MNIDLGKTLILSPHADDWFLGCTTILKHLSGTMILMSYWAGEQQDIMVEFEECWKRYADRTRWNYRILNFPTRRFDSHTTEIRDAISKYVDQLQPDAILIPAGRHPDHIVTSEQADAAALHLNSALILFYPDKVDRNPTPNMLQPLETHEVDKKRETWTEVWRTQHWRKDNPKRVDEPQLDGFERFYWIRGRVSWG